MSIQIAKRWLSLTALVGGVMWFIAWASHLDQRSFLDEIELLFFFGVAVITPLAMQLGLCSDRNGQIPLIFRIAIGFHPFVIIAVALSLRVDSPFIALILAGFWQLQTLLLAGYGLQRLLPRPTLAIEELCIDAGHIYVAVSGVWFLAYSVDYRLLTFDSVFVLLTAVHFTFISLGALIIAGMIGRSMFGTPIWKFYRLLAWIIVISPALVATGITVTQFSGRLWLEVGSVLILASSFLMLALLYFYKGLPAPFSKRVLSVLSLSALLVTMSIALAYSLGRFTGWWSLSLIQMVQWHGWLNAIGFAFCGLLALYINTPAPNVTASGIPFSHLPWRWHIGAHFFERINALEAHLATSPTGIVDRLQDYARKDFKPDAIAPSITAFYEQTATHDLLVYPEWQPRFQLLARIYKRLSRRVGQMNFPTQPDTHESRITSTIVPLRDALDGREHVRGWVRVYTETQQTVYVAAYSSHQYKECRYMNIAFPLPFGNLTSILRLENLLVNNDGLMLKSYSTRHGDQGVYFVSRFVTIRLPINETIRVYSGEISYEGFPPNFSGDGIIAEHKTWIFGLHCLTLHYQIHKQA